MATTDRADPVSWVSTSTHAVLLCGSPRHWQRAAVSFLAEGLAQGDPVIYLNGIYPDVQVLGLLGLPDAKRSVQPGQQPLLISPITQTLVPDGIFDSQTARENLGRLIEETGARAGARPRLLLDMNWGSYLRMGIPQLLDCEHWLNEELIPRYGCTTLCHYELMLFTPMVMRVVAENHSVVLGSQPSPAPAFIMDGELKIDGTGFPLRSKDGYGRVC